MKVMKLQILQNLIRVSEIKVYGWILMNFAIASSEYFYWVIAIFIRLKRACIQRNLFITDILVVPNAFHGFMSDQAWIRLALYPYGSFYNSANIYLFKVSIGSARTMCEIVDNEDNKNTIITTKLRHLILVCL